MALIDDGSSLIHLANGFTLVDITKTGDVSSINSVTRNQQRNYETLFQVLGLRSQIMSMTEPIVQLLDITGSKFGSKYSGFHHVWSFTFGVEKDMVYAKTDDPFGSLKEDFINVPIIDNLEESISFSTPSFIVAGPETNIYFKTLSIWDKYFYESSRAS